jgi:hypothetical protein
MGYVGKISKSITAHCNGNELPVFYLGGNVFSLGKIYGIRNYNKK